MQAAICFVALAFVGLCFFGGRFLRRWSPMLPVPIQSMFTYCALFTLGIAFLSTRAPILVPFGLVFTFVGIAIFLPEQFAARFLGAFILMLCLALLSVLNELRTEAPLFRPQRLTLWSAGAFGLLWGIGILFAWRRWSDVRVQKP
jgi:hypothetical protein